MGLSGHLYETSASDIVAWMHGGEQQCAEIRHTFLDREWWMYAEVFKDTGPPLNRLMSGDLLHPLSPHTLNEFRFESAADWYLGIYSPGLVRDLANALEAVPLDQMKSAYAALGYAFNHWSEERTFNDLKAAFRNAADAGNGLRIMIH